MGNFLQKYFMEGKQKSKEKKSNHNILLRLDHETNEMLEQFSKIYKTNKTQLIRTSITNTVNLNLGNPLYPNPKSIFSQSILHYLFDRCQENELHELAKISYDLSLIEAYNSAMVKSMLDEGDAQNLATMLVKYILSPKGHSWFDECQYIVRGSHVSIYGNHNLGPNFHIFVKALLQLYFHHTNYEIIRDRQDLESLFEQSKTYDMTHVKRKFYKFSVTFAPKKRN